MSNGTIGGPAWATDGDVGSNEVSWLSGKPAIVSDGYMKQVPLHWSRGIVRKYCAQRRKRVQGISDTVSKYTAVRGGEFDHARWLQFSLSAHAGPQLLSPNTSRLASTEV